MSKLTRIACVLLMLAFVMRAAADTKRPNILVIVADDLGYADIGAQGQEKDVRTPNVDSIAKAGVRFTNGYVTCPVCSPTRAGLMTGRYQTRFGHEVNPGPNTPENFGLPLDQVTMGQAFKSAGYTTGAIGKWHLGFKTEMMPTHRGFDEFYGFLGGAHSYTEVTAGKIAKNSVLRGEKPVESVTYLTDDFGREAGDFVDRHASEDKPFFLYLAFNAVHTPMQATQKYLDRFKDEPDKKRRTLLAKLSALDDAVGLVLGKLREHKIEDNTLIFFISDNGGPTGSNGSRNYPLRGFKGQVFEGGIREPFCVQWNGHIPAGKVDDRTVVSLDIFPTALAAAGAEKPAGDNLDGENLLPFLKEGNTDVVHPSLYWRFGPQWAIRDGNMKLMHNVPNGTMLFDLGKDMSETHDLASSQPDEVKRLKAKYDAWNSKNIAPLWHDSREGKRAGNAKATDAKGEDDE